MPFVVATYVYAAAKGSARTPLGPKITWGPLPPPPPPPPPMQVLGGQVMYFQNLSSGSETSDMTSYGLGEMF